MARSEDIDATKDLIPDLQSDLTPSKYDQGIRPIIRGAANGRLLHLCTSNRLMRHRCFLSRTRCQEKAKRRAVGWSARPTRFRRDEGCKDGDGDGKSSWREGWRCVPKSPFLISGWSPFTYLQDGPALGVPPPLERMHVRSHNKLTIPRLSSSRFLTKVSYLRTIVCPALLISLLWLWLYP